MALNLEYVLTIDANNSLKVKRLGSQITMTITLNNQPSSFTGDLTVADKLATMIHQAVYTQDPDANA